MWLIAFGAGRDTINKIILFLSCQLKQHILSEEMENWSGQLTSYYIIFVMVYYTSMTILVDNASAFWS